MEREHSSTLTHRVHLVRPFTAPLPAKAHTYLKNEPCFAVSRSEDSGLWQLSRAFHLAVLARTAEEEGEMLFPSRTDPICSQWHQGRDSWFSNTTTKTKESQKPGRSVYFGHPQHSDRNSNYSFTAGCVGSSVCLRERSFSRRVDQNCAHFPSSYLGQVKELPVTEQAQVRLRAFGKDLQSGKQFASINLARNPEGCICRHCCAVPTRHCSRPHQSHGAGCSLSIRPEANARSTEQQTETPRATRRSRPGEMGCPPTAAPGPSPRPLILSFSGRTRA